MAQTTNVLIGDRNTNSGNIIGSFNNTVYRSDEDAQIMRWLSPLEPNNRHQGVRTDRLDGVGDWLLETSEFREWRQSADGADKAVLFCSGGPGVGKTYLSSLVIDSLCDQAKKGDIAVACLYCDYLSQQEQTITNMVGAILKQLAGRGDIPKYLREAFREGKSEIGGRALRLPDLMGMLRTTIASLPQVFICIDALDECLPKHLPELLESLRNIVREAPRTRIFLTGRPHVWEDIRRYFDKAILVPVNPSTDDIKNYVKMRMDRDNKPEAMNGDLRADITKIILERISDMFLLVSLHMDTILGEVTIRQRRKKLEEMTRGNGLSDAYTSTLTRLKAQKGGESILGMKALMWVVYSKRPLQAEELCHALGVEMGSADLDPDNVPALRTLLASTLGLVTVEASSSTVRLVHFTLQEHLSSDSTLFPSPHSTIAEVCLTYLNFECVRDLSPTLRSAPSNTPLLEYASHYWGDHTRREKTENAKMLALRLLDEFDEHISAQLLLFHYRRNTHPPTFWFTFGERTRFTGLHAVAFLGIAGIVDSVLAMKEWDVNAIDYYGSTALIWATIRGHEGVVKMLLERAEVNPDQADTKYGRTPLSWAAENGHERVVQMLLERAGVNPDQAGERGWTPLLWAAKNGNERVVQMLLEQAEVNPDQADTEYGRTPLSWAALYGHEGIVKMLFERAEVNPDQADTKYGRTPLSWAAKNGHERVVQMLLERAEVNPNQADTEYGLTPLSLAAQYGHEGVVKILLERAEVNPYRADKYGRTPLSWAAKNGNERVVKMLLERAEVNPDQAGEHGWTPLLWAAENGNERVVKMLLERAEVNPDQADTYYGRTPLSRAAKNGNERVVKMLLERAEVNPDQADTKYGRTPLSWAALKGYEGIVRMLLSRNDVRTDTPDNQGQTPLLLALSKGQDQVVRILQERDNTNSDTADLSGQSSILPPTGPVDESVVEMQSRSDDRTQISQTLTTNLHSHQQIPMISDINNPVSKFPDNGLPPTVPPALPQPPPTPPLEPRYPPNQTDTLPNNTPSTPSIAVAWYFVIASSACLLAFLVYVAPSSLLDIFLFYKCC